MNMIRNYLKSITSASAIIAFGLLLVACQSASGGSNSPQSGAISSADGSGSSNSGSSSIGGAFSNYHDLYNQINGTFVNVNRAFVRTNDGRRIPVAFAPKRINLGDMLGATKGFVISLKNLRLSPNITKLEIVEVELRLSGPDNQVTFSDQTSCKLKARRALVFYTRQFFTVDLNNDYLVKVKFDSLNSVQLACRGHSENHKHCDKNHHRDDEGNNIDSNDPINNVCKLKCSLASQREEIVNIIDVKDEF